MLETHCFLQTWLEHRFLKTQRKLCLNFFLGLQSGSPYLNLVCELWLAFDILGQWYCWRRWHYCGLDFICLQLSSILWVQSSTCLLSRVWKWVSDSISHIFLVKNSQLLIWKAPSDWSQACTFCLFRASACTFPYEYLRFALTLIHVRVGAGLDTEKDSKNVLNYVSTKHMPLSHRFNGSMWFLKCFVASGP